MDSKDEQEYQILNMLDSASEPQGCGQLTEALLAAGQSVSEATIGRMLRGFDHRGYTVRVGYQGRVLAPGGKARLEELSRLRNETFYSNEFRRLLRGKGKGDLIDALTARRAIEQETARLAALNARPDEIAELKANLEDQQTNLLQGHNGAVQDLTFHRVIAKAGRNKLLAAALELIRQNGLDSPVLAYIRGRVGSTLVTDHRTIVSAIERRDPAAASAAMREHIEGLIRDVERYWAIATEGGEGREARSTTT